MGFNDNFFMKSRHEITNAVLHQDFEQRFRIQVNSISTLSRIKTIRVSHVLATRFIHSCLQQLTYSRTAQRSTYPALFEAFVNALSISIIVGCSEEILVPVKIVSNDQGIIYKTIKRLKLISSKISYGGNTTTNTFKVLKTISVGRTITCQVNGIDINTKR